jgi:hypothetical protein
VKGTALKVVKTSKEIINKQNDLCSLRNVCCVHYSIRESLFNEEESIPESQTDSNAHFVARHHILPIGQARNCTDKCDCFVSTVQTIWFNRFVLQTKGCLLSALEFVVSRSIESNLFAEGNISSVPGRNKRQINL